MAKKEAKKIEDVKVITIEKKAVVKCVSPFYDIKADLTRRPVGGRFRAPSRA